MSAKLKTATAIASGAALAALGIPAGSAQAAAHPAHPGTTVPLLGSGSHPKAASPDASCGNSITWQDRHDNKYLEIYHSGLSNGNWADAYNGNGTCTQHWYAVVSGYVSNGNGYTFDTYGMVNTNSDKCLAAPTTNIGNAHVVQESCGFDSYTYRWVELSVPNGWDLVEARAPGYTINGTLISYGIIACEDEHNHWIYTSHGYDPATGVNNLEQPNCVWH
jgi:hypothetical protein